MSGGYARDYHVEAPEQKPPYDFHIELPQDPIVTGRVLISIDLFCVCAVLLA